MLQLSSTSTNAEQLLWLLPDGTTVTGAAANYTLRLDSLEVIQLIAINACSRDTAAQSFLLASLSTQDLGLTPQVYPNPTTGLVYINAAEPLRTIRVLTPEGRVLRRYQPTGLRTELDVSSLPAGVYFLELTRAAGVYFNRLVLRP